MYNVLSRGHWNCAIFDVRKENSSDLLSGSRRNIIQFFGCFVWPATFLLTPWPLFSLVASFRLSGTYVSHTTSTRLLWWSCCWRWGMNTFSAYSSNVEASTVGRQWTITAPSNTLLSIWAVGSVSPLLFGCRHFNRSDLALGMRRFPNSDSAGGKDWTSWLKNYLISPSRLCNATCNWTKRFKLLWRTAIFSPCFEASFLWFLLKIGRLFFLTGLWIDLERSLVTSLT